MCQNLPEGRTYDTLMARSCNLVHLLLGRIPLPVPTMMGPFVFDVPYNDEGRSVLLNMFCSYVVLNNTYYNSIINTKIFFFLLVYDRIFYNRHYSIRN